MTDERKLLTDQYNLQFLYCPLVFKEESPNRSQIVVLWTIKSEQQVELSRQVGIKLQPDQEAISGSKELKTKDF